MIGGGFLQKAPYCSFSICLCIPVYSCFNKGCPKKRKSVRNNAKRWSGKYSINFNKHIKNAQNFVSFNTRKQEFIAPPSNALKTCELDDATVNNHNPSCLSVLSRTL